MEFNQSFQADAEELLPVCDKNGNIVGSELRSVCHKNGLIHPVVHVHIINSKGEIFLQKRSMKKLIQPGKWDTSVGGHITFGEEIKEALKREAWEEAGVENGEFQHITDYLWQSKVEKEFVHVFKCKYDTPKIIAKAEIDEGRFFSENKILEMIGKDVLTPNFEKEFMELKDKILN